MKCYELHNQCDVPCDLKDCRRWIEYEEDLNCSEISIKKHGKMGLREVAERLGVSFVRVKQIEDKALEKVRKRLPKTIDITPAELKSFLLED